jgi:hypothetical protein
LSIVALAQAAVRATAPSGAGSASTVQLHLARYEDTGVPSVRMPCSFWMKLVPLERPVKAHAQVPRALPVVLMPAAGS